MCERSLRKRRSGSDSGADAASCKPLECVPTRIAIFVPVYDAAIRHGVMVYEFIWAIKVHIDSNSRIAMSDRIVQVT